MNSKKIIALYYARSPRSGENADSGYMYNNHPQWRNYPHELMLQIEKSGAIAVLVGENNTYIGDNTFSHYWLPSKKEMGLFEKVNQPIKVDAIFNKGYFNGDASFAYVNIPEVQKIGRDKALQSVLFEQWQPKTAKANTNGLRQAIESIPGDMVVIKPTDQNGGHGIIIDDKAKVLSQIDSLEDRDWVVQQFVDSSRGINGLFKGTHDLRLYIINGVCSLASVRQPKAGKLVANTSQGGSINFFAPSDIPKEPIAIAKKIDEFMAKFGNRYYSVDFISDGDDWYILEVNDRPGVPAQFQSPEVINFQKKLAGCIIGAVSNPLNKIVKE